MGQFYYPRLLTVSDFITGTSVINFVALPDPTLNSGKLALVLNTTGLWLISLKSKGLYYSDGASWTYEGDYSLTQDASQIVNTPSGSIVDTFVQGAINAIDGRVTTAQSTANTALANAATAQSTANTALANAATAQGTANAAEPSSNKSTDTALGTSNTLFPTQNAVKAYVDAHSGGASPVEIELNFGALPGVKSKKFTVTDAAIVATNYPVVTHLFKAATGRAQDENEFDTFSCRTIAAAGSFDVYIDSINGVVSGLYKFVYKY